MHQHIDLIYFEDVAPNASRETGLQSFGREQDEPLDKSAFVVRLFMIFHRLPLIKDSDV